MKCKAMNRLQLATLISWAGESGFQGRKRLQKVVFFLQEAGCPLDCQYTLHHYGPYSQDVADRCDEMFSAGLLEEKTVSTGSHLQYSYKLTPETSQHLHKSTDHQLEPFRDLGERLIGEGIWLLELGSTVLYFFQQVKDWDKALEAACAFKKVAKNEQQSVQSLTLAESMWKASRNR
jgi:uncharacterized protein